MAIICLSILACLLTYIVPWRLIRGLILVSAFDLHGSLTFWSGLIEVCRAFHIMVFSKPKLKVEMDLESWQIIALKYEMWNKSKNDKWYLFLLWQLDTITFYISKSMKLWNHLELLLKTPQNDRNLGRNSRK